MIDITALDLSLTGTGWATLENPVITTGRITTKLRGCDRIISVARQAADLCTGRVVVMEGPSYGSNEAFSHEGAGLWWQVRLELYRTGATVIVIPPACVKKYATGKGTADKPSVLAQACYRFPSTSIRTTDEADALWMLAMTCERYGQPICDLPAVNRSVIHSIVKATKRVPAHPAIAWPAITLWEKANARF